MCGIAGIASLSGRPVQLDAVRAMCRALVHRGPDDEGLYTGEGVALGIRRLRIIDPDGSDQPITNEDGSVWVIFNGEIYNFAGLRSDLERRGHVFSTSGDTETLVHLYEEFGVDCVDHLRGMFAFALWDERRRLLLLARDRVGIKPLYYAKAGGYLLFASELKALLEQPQIARRLNWSAVNHLFTFGSTSVGESILADVHKLRPGHRLVAIAGRPPRVERYWDLHFAPDHGRSEADVAERLRELLDESVRLHMVSDVPVGAFLSGGVDSSAVVAAMSRLAPSPVKTFSIGFDEHDFSELEYARSIARRFETEHHELLLAPDVLGILEDVTRHLDEPFGDASAIPTYMVSKLASQHVRVALSGDGGDELFAGYDRYQVEGRERRLEPPAVARRLFSVLADAMPDGMRGGNILRHFSLPAPVRYLDAATLFRHQAKQKLFRSEIFELFCHDDPFGEALAVNARGPAHWLSGLQYLDINTYLPLDILTKVDRMSMAHSLEVRVPLLDHVLLEFAATIPPEMLLRGTTGKHVFKRAMRGTLPDAIVDRRKQGFGVPLAPWFRGRSTAVLRDVLLSRRSRQRGVFDLAYVERLIARQAAGRELDLQLWLLVSFELWCRTFLDAPPAPAAESLRPVVEVGR
jgi:asparagine synthase (glutamine-hydrolysing)